MFGKRKKEKEPQVDLRRAPRHAFYHPTFFCLDGVSCPHAEDCDIFDLSDTGVRFHSQKELQPGTKITLLIKHHGKLLKLNAVIMWHKYFAEHKYGARLSLLGDDWPVLLEQLVHEQAS